MDHRGLQRVVVRVEDVGVGRNLREALVGADRIRRDVVLRYLGVRLALVGVEIPEQMRAPRAHVSNRGAGVFDDFVLNTERPFLDGGVFPWHQGGVQSCGIKCAGCSTGLVERSVGDVDGTIKRRAEGAELTVRSPAVVKDSIAGADGGLAVRKGIPRNADARSNGPLVAGEKGAAVRRAVGSGIGVVAAHDDAVQQIAGVGNDGAVGIDRRRLGWVEEGRIEGAEHVVQFVFGLEVGVTQRSGERQVIPYLDLIFRVRLEVIPAIFPEGIECSFSVVGGEA